jgi:hypothetical protein
MMEKYLLEQQFLPEMTNASLIKKIVLLVISTLFFAGCATMIEGQHLHAFRKTFNYKTYRFASEKAIKRTVAEYNKTVSEPVDKTMTHALLGIVWFIADKSDYSFIEADIIRETSTNETKILAMGLQSIALSKMECPRLARVYFNELKTSFTSQQKSNPHFNNVEHKMMLISLIAASLYQDDLDMAKWTADTLGTGSQLDYLPPLVGAVVETKKGSPLKAMKQLQELSKNQKFSDHHKTLFSESADIIKSCPEQDQLEQELVDKLILQVVKGALDDVFSNENQQAFLKNVMTFSERFPKGK